MIGFIAFVVDTEGNRIGIQQNGPQQAYVGKTVRMALDGALGNDDVPHVMFRRATAGTVLLVLGLLLTSPQRTAGTGGVVPQAILMVGVVSGVGVYLGSPRARLLGLVGSCLAFVVSASLALQALSSPFLGFFFSPPDSLRWYVVMPVGYVWAFLSLLSGTLLLLPFAPPRKTPDNDQPSSG